MSGSAPAVAFLDRDGTIIVDRGYVGDPAEVELLPRAAEAIQRLNARRIPAVVVTNQSGIGRGMFDERAFRSVQREVERRLAMRGAALDAVYHCPHRPEEGCGCRKPGLAMYERAARRFGVSLASAAFVGDRARDVLPALEAGGRGYLLRGARAEDADDEVPEGCEAVEDLWEAVARMLDAGADGVR